MNNRSIRIRSKCPCCSFAVSSTSLYLSNTFEQRLLKQDSYSSRKVPEFISYQLNYCPSCDLIFAPYVPCEKDVLRSYKNSVFVSAEESLQASKTYQTILSSTFAFVDYEDLIVDVGASDGSFIQRLLESGFRHVKGVEPSSEAVGAAPLHVRPLIQIGNYRNHLSELCGARVITSFMTLEHLVDPFDAVSSFYKSLKMGGTLCLVVHNHKSLVNRILGRRSPIIDLEHMQLFSPKSVTSLLRSVGFRDLTMKSFSNSYSLAYWLRLSPLPLPLKSLIIHLLKLLKLQGVLIPLPVGNICVTAVK